MGGLNGGLVGADAYSYGGNKNMEGNKSLKRVWSLMLRGMS